MPCPTIVYEKPILKFFHMDGKKNPADTLSKHYSHADVWKHLEPLMFWKGIGPNLDVEEVQELIVKKAVMKVVNPGQKKGSVRIPTGLVLTL